MKTTMKRAIRDEKGNAFILVLILLVVGGLVLTPMLGLMSTGLVSGQVYEKKTAELYAADAGVEDAIWRIQTNNLTWDNHHSGPWNLAVNGKNVTVEVYREDMDLTPCVDDFTYQILSNAATHDAGNTAAIDSTTTIDAHVTTTVKYYPGIMDQMITIQKDLAQKEIDDLLNDLKNLDMPCPSACTNCSVCRTVYNYSDYDKIPTGCKGCVAVYNFPAPAWPPVSELSARYLNDVVGAAHYYENIEIDLAGANITQEPLYVDGELTILNKHGGAATLTLNGTLYITGTTAIGMQGSGGKPNLTLQLNGQTIFVANDSTGTGQEALSIGDWCTINGPGVIVAVGDIYFKPNGYVGGNAQPSFVLSVSGTTTIQPGADFLGSVAGKVDVEVGSGGKAITQYPTDGFGDLNFPTPLEDRRVYGIASWEINPR